MEKGKENPEPGNIGFVHRHCGVKDYSDKSPEWFVGRAVKVIFKAGRKPRSWDGPWSSGERMWVWVKGVKDGKLSGTLDNTPVVIQNLKRGDTVEFDPKEVIDVLNA